MLTVSSNIHKLAIWRHIFLVLGLCALLVPLAAESVTLPQDGVINVKVRVSKPDQVFPRTVVFPVEEIGDIPELFSRDQLYVKQIRNTLILHLKDRSFGGTLQAFDATGRLYLLNIIPAKDTEKVAESLQIELPRRRASAQATQGGGGHAVVERAFTLFDHMLGYRRRGDIRTVDATVVRDGEISIGRRIYEDDDVQMLLMRIHQGQGLRGYECVFTYRGKRPMRLDFQRIYFPGAIAVYAGQEAFMDPMNPGRDIRPGQSIKVYYVGR